MATSQADNAKKEISNRENAPQLDALQSPNADGQPSNTDQQPEVVWDDGKMTTNFANVVNIQSSLEQLDLCFGTNHTWNLGNKRRVNVELTNRIIMSPPAAKRLHQALERVLQQHESRYGKLPGE